MSALNFNTTGSANAAFGANALNNLSSGDSNIAIGVGAGINLTTGGSNVYIGNQGVSSESNAIRIGDVQTAALMAGINGATSASGVAVLVNSSGQLGTVPAARDHAGELLPLEKSADLKHRRQELGLLQPDIARAIGVRGRPAA